MTSISLTNKYLVKRHEHAFAVPGFLLPLNISGHLDEKIGPGSPAVKKSSNLPQNTGGVS